MKDIGIKLAHPVLHWVKELLSNYIPSKFDVTLRGLDDGGNIPFQDNDASMTLVQTPGYDPVRNKFMLKFSVKVKFRHTCDKVVLFMTPKELYGTKVVAREIECDNKVTPRGKRPYEKGRWYTFDIYYELVNKESLCKEEAN